MGPEDAPIHSSNVPKEVRRTCFHHPGLNGPLAGVWGALAGGADARDMHLVTISAHGYRSMTASPQACVASSWILAVCGRGADCGLWDRGPDLSQPRHAAGDLRRHTSTQGPLTCWHRPDRGSAGAHVG